MLDLQNVSKEDIISILAKIDKEGVPEKNQSTEYDLKYQGNYYPPKYVISSITGNNDFNSHEANDLLEKLGFQIVKKYEKYTLTITANHIESTDENFTMDNLYLGDTYTPLKTYLSKSDNTIIERNRIKKERQISNQTLPKLVFQIFENDINNLSKDERNEFPIFKPDINSELIKGIYDSVDEYHSALKTKSYEYMIYKGSDNKEYVIYCWNIFSTIIFAQECLKRFGKPGDKFILVYRKKTQKEEQENVINENISKENFKGIKEYVNPYSKILIESKNVIFRGAPGTGKTYQAKSIAADIVSDGYFQDYESLDDEQKSRIGFVQFHPSYDYTDFVEGLRPQIVNNEMIFERQDGIFKKFVDKARHNYEGYNKTKSDLINENNINTAIAKFLDEVEIGVPKYSTKGTKNVFSITGYDEKNIYIFIPNNPTRNELSIKINKIKLLLSKNQKITTLKQLTEIFEQNYYTQENSYILPLYTKIKEYMNQTNDEVYQPQELKKYVFIIDEINRGDISKIFGELFFSIDPNYRGEKGSVFTEYSNMHDDENEKFYIPDNVYIIGTMNDIDRSVDSFDFAMRRRFRFIELKADEEITMLDELKDENKKNKAIACMNSLNNEIKNTDGLNENYQIGAAYFLKLKTLNLNFDELWDDCLEPLLKEYVQGSYNEDEIMTRFKNAYYSPLNEENKEQSNED